MLRDDVAAHHARHIGVFTSALDSLEVDSWLIVELLVAAERRDRVSTAIPWMSVTSCPMPFVPGNDLNASKS